MNSMDRKLILRWGITFLKGDSRLSLLSQESRDYLMKQATGMYFEEKRARKLLNDELEGALVTEGKYVVLGIFGGQEFKAHIDCKYGDFNISFLVSEQTTRGAQEYTTYFN